MTGLHLDVQLRVAGGGVVRDRRVAHVVEHTKRFGGPRLDRRPQVGSRQLGRVKWGAQLAVAEDKVGVGLITGFLPLLVEHGDDCGAELERPKRFSALGRLEDAANECLADGDSAFKQLYVAPAQREQFAATGTDEGSVGVGAWQGQVGP
jgi:hypothetical protein